MDNFKNTLYYGDNLEILREYIPDESVDLIYLDPPFNSKKAYNIIFKDKSGRYPPSQIKAFDDTWHWSEETEQVMWELHQSQYPPELVRMLDSMRNFLGTSDMMAYLVMMAIRLWELHRVLKPTGSIYLHCDPTASHYLKILMDQIFGVKNFRNEIIWKRTFAHNDPKRFGNNYDVLLFYTKSDRYTFNHVYVPYSKDYVERFFRHEDNGRRYQLITLTGAGVTKGESGKPWRGYNPSSRNRHWSVPQRVVNRLVGEEKAKKMSIFERLELLYRHGYIVFSKKGVPRLKQFLDEMPGVPAQAIWDDIPPVSAHSKERLGYPTQKPLALLERIIKASSNEGDIVLDPFCGCGTAVVAAEKLGRKWIGIDITVLAINLIEKRLKEHFPDVKYDVIGLPKDLPSAKKLAETREGKLLFQHWFITSLGGQPYKSAGGADTGIDGFMYFKDIDGLTRTIIISVKAGNYGPSAIRDLKGVLEREHADMGLLLALKPPSRKTIEEAVSAGLFHMPGTSRTYPRIQIFTAQEYFEGKRPNIPDVSDTLKKAKRQIREREKPQNLNL